MTASWDVIRRCRHCNDDGQLPDGAECSHQEVYVAAAAKGAAAARAKVRTRPCCRFHTATCGIEDWCCDACPEMHTSIGRPQHPVEPTGDRS